MMGGEADQKATSPVLGSMGLLLGSVSVARIAMAPDGHSGNASQTTRRGVVGSTLVHLLVVALFIFWLDPSARLQEPAQKLVMAVPVELVELAAQTASPPAERIATVPQQQRSALLKQPLPQTATPRAAEASTPEGVAPQKTRPPPDDLALKLDALSKLQQPDTDPRLSDEQGMSNVSATSKGAGLGTRATYSLKDYIRAQVERRWSLDLGTLGGRDFNILIHVVLKRDGTITAAEIVDQQRSGTDAQFHSVALSARNAVLLSSPLALPPGSYAARMDVTLDLNPRDTLR